MLDFTIRFDPPGQTPVRNFLTGAEYLIARGDSVPMTAGRRDEIIKICNEPDVYGWLFRDLLAGKPYGSDQAYDFARFIAAGWTAGTHFVFLVTSPAGEIAAACDIKSNQPNDAEIGYWASAKHRGVMTNAVVELCKLAQRAGFRSLCAGVKRGNRRSAGVLRRAGFSPDTTISERADIWRFRRIMAPVT